MKTSIPFVLLSLLVAATHAEDRHIDPRIWFASPAAEAADRATLLTETAALPVLDHPAPGALLDYLHQGEHLLAHIQRHAAWLHLRTAEDIDDHAAAEAQ